MYYLAEQVITDKIGILGIISISLQILLEIFKYISNFENISGSIDFKYFNENLAILLNNDKKLEKLVKHISEDIEDTLDYLKLS